MVLKRIILIVLSIGAVILIVPISMQLLYVSMITNPIIKNDNYENNAYQVFLKHFSKTPHNAISVYNPKHAKQLFGYLLKQSHRTDIALSDKARLRDFAYDIIVHLQKKYPFDAYFMLAKAEILTQKSQFIQGYDALKASYAISQCSASIMQYRIHLKTQYHLLIADKIGDDIRHIKHNHCDTVKL
jgi:hypothetical protein